MKDIYRERELLENDHRGEICPYIYICLEKKETSFEIESSDRWKDGALARINLCTCIHGMCNIYIYVDYIEIYIYMYAKYIDMCVYVHVNPRAFGCFEPFGLGFRSKPCLHIRFQIWPGLSKPCLHIRFQMPKAYLSKGALPGLLSSQAKGVLRIDRSIQFPTHASLGIKC